MFETRFFIKAYNYWWGYTAAQIELMALDMPLVSYSHTKKDDDAFKNPTKKKMQDFYERWKAMRGGKTFAGGQYSVEDIFNS